MSLHRRAAKRDGNERLIIETLEARGFSVSAISGKGVPDLLVGRRGSDRVWLVEVKNPQGKNRASSAQVEWRNKWTGPKPITLRSVEDAIKFPEAG